MATHQAFIGIGSNIEPRTDYLHAAVEALADTPNVTIQAVSEIRETAPVGPICNQPAYLNAAVELETVMQPHDLLVALLDIERAHGRNRDDETRWGPRTLDLDLLLYGDLVLDEPGLQIPHPRLAERRFVLEPLSDLAPDLVVPGTDESVAVLLDRAIAAESQI